MITPKINKNYKTGKKKKKFHFKNYKAFYEINKKKTWWKGEHQVDYYQDGFMFTITLY